MAGQAAVTTGADLVDEEVEAVLAEFDGDVRRAIRALLDDLAALAEDRAEVRNFLRAYGHLELVKLP